MRHARLFAPTLLLCALALPGLAQNPQVDEFAKHWTRSKEFTLAVAEAMPEAGYDFKPNAEEMSFGQLMAHIAQANGNYFAPITGEKNPITKPEKFDKATTMKMLNDSFDYCAKMVGTLKPEQLEAMSGPEGRQMTGRERMWGAFTHTAHHRGQAEVYLRVKEIKPPAYKF